MDIYIDIECNKRKTVKKLEWEILLYGGSLELKRTLNTFRVTYVKELKDHINSTCGNGVCTPREVGTVSKTHISDVDINLNFDGKSVKEGLNMISRVYDAINKYHYSRFHTSYSVLFDINIYGSNFDESAYTECGKNDMACFKAVVNDERQRLFSMLRLAEHCTHKRFIGARAFHREMADEISGKSYTSSLERFYKSDNIKTALHLFSLSKLFEKDVYYSIGAFLHIVGGRKDLPPTLYADSIMDNLGFAVEALQYKPECIKYPLAMAMMRVAKYLSRIIDAYELSTGKKKQIKRACDALNKQRKEGSAPTMEYVKAVYVEIGVTVVTLAPTRKNVEKKLVEYVWDLYITLLGTR